MPNRSIPWAIVLGMLCAAAAGAGSLGTEFTYQGTLSESGGPANGTYDFRFLLYDTDVGGSQVGSIVYVDDLAVADGRVVTQLDFGGLFDGTALWLEIHVRDGASTGGYSVLFPRQELTAAPYAQHSVQAQSATVAGDADMLDGHDSPYYLAWGNLTGVPGGLDDGDDDTLGALICADGEVAKWSPAGWNCRPDEGVTFARTYVVGPVGTPSDNGTALLAAMAAIPAPASQEDARLLKIEPGLYDLGTGSLAMKEWVDVEGSGRDVTTITSAICSLSDGTVVGAPEAELRHLTIGNTGNACPSNDYATAVYNQATGFRMANLNLSVSATGDFTYCFGVLNSGGSVSMNHLSSTVQCRYPKGVYSELGPATMSDISATVTSSWGEPAKGVVASSDSTLDGIWVEVDSAPPGNGCIGIELYGSNIALRNAIATSTTDDSRGVRVNADGGTVEIANVTASAEYAGVEVSVAFTSTDLVILRGVRATASGHFGLYASGSSGAMTVLCDGCQLSGGTHSVQDFAGSTTFKIGASMLDGTVSGSVTCAGVYDENYVFYPSSCPP